MNRSLYIAIDGVEDCEYFGIFNEEMGENSLATFDAFGPIVKAVETVMKRDGSVRKDPLIEEINEQTDYTYSSFDEDGSFCYAVTKEEDTSCMDASIANAYITIAPNKTITVGQFFIECSANEDEEYEPVPELIQSHWENGEWVGTIKEWRKLRSFIRYANGGENIGPWIDENGIVYSLQDQSGALYN